MIATVWLLAAAWIALALWRGHSWHPALPWRTGRALRHFLVLLTYIQVGGMLITVGAAHQLG